MNLARTRAGGPSPDQPGSTFSLKQMNKKILDNIFTMDGISSGSTELAEVLPSPAGMHPTINMDVLTGHLSS